MKPNATTIERTTTSLGHEITMGIDVKSLPHIMDVLTNLYSDPITAVIREISTNARDSNIEAGSTRPIRVSLPSRLDPEFSVQDHGVGLNVEDMENIYSLYGASTKRESDEVTGLLGLGCKSPLTYTDQFTVIGVKNCVRTVALISRNEDGVGIIQILDERPTDEPNGVKVTVPVKSSDVNMFTAKAQEFFQFWRDGVELVGAEIPELKGIHLDPDVMMVSKSDLFVAEKPNYGYSYRQQRDFMVMGGVPYPCDLKIRSAGMRSYIFVCWVPMGAIDFTPSREEIHDTEHTKLALAEAGRWISDWGYRELASKLSDQADSAWDFLNKISKYGISGNSVTYQGRAVDPYLKLPDRLRRENYKIWHLIDYRKNAESNNSYAIPLTSTSERTTFITGFPNKRASRLNKEKIEKHLEASDLPSGYVVLLPSGVDTYWLDGFPNICEWSEVDKTEVEAVQASNDSAPDYEGWKSSARVYFNELDDSETVLYVGITDLGDDDGIRTNRARIISNIFDVTLVPLGANRIDKFCRLHPHAEEAKAWMRKKIEELVDNATELELLSLVRDMRGVWDSIDLTDVDSPEMKKLAQISKLRQSDDVRDELKMLRSISTSYLPDWLRTTKPNQLKTDKYRELREAVVQQYPLITSHTNTTNIEEYIAALDFYRAHQERNNT